MIKKIRFPKFDANITEGMVGVWRRTEGEAVHAGEPIVEIITDKATFDLESEVDGTLKKIIAKEKSAVPVGYIIAIVGDNSDEAPDVSEENEKIVAEHRTAALQIKRMPNTKESRPEAAGGERVRAVPAARRLAREAGINIADVSPSNGNLIITEEDVKRYLKSTSDKGGNA